MSFRCVKCPDLGRSAGKQEHGKMVVEDLRSLVICFGLMCKLCIGARLARPGEEANLHHAAVLEEANPHLEEATTVLEDASRQETLTEKVQEHVAVYNRNKCRIPGQSVRGGNGVPMEPPESSAVMDIVRSLAETRVFVHHPCHKNLSKTSLFLHTSYFPC